jgi:hypothetical protein
MTSTVILDDPRTPPSFLPPVPLLPVRLPPQAHVPVGRQHAGALADNSSTIDAMQIDRPGGIVGPGALLPVVGNDSEALESSYGGLR